MLDVGAHGASTALKIRAIGPQTARQTSTAVGQPRHFAPRRRPRARYRIKDTVAHYCRTHGAVAGSAQRAGAVARAHRDNLAGGDAHFGLLRHLPAVELARLSCVHKSLRIAWQQLRQQHPGKRYARPTAELLAELRDYYPGTLARAVALGDFAVIQSMVAAGVERGKPLLQELSTFGKECVVDEALWRAAEHGHVQAVELLLGFGADVHSRHDDALLWATRNGHADVMEFLLQHGADVHAHDEMALLQLYAFRAELVHVLLQHGADVHAKDDAALRWASSHGRADTAQLLLQHGASVHACDDGALLTASMSGHAAVVQLLLQHGADLHAQDDQALRWAARCGHADVVELLIQNGANIHALNDDALKGASESGRTAVVQLLIQHGARLPTN